MEFVVLIINTWTERVCSAGLLAGWKIVFCSANNREEKKIELVVLELLILFYVVLHEIWCRFCGL